MRILFTLSARKEQRREALRLRSRWGSTIQSRNFLRMIALLFAFLCRQSNAEMQYSYTVWSADDGLPQNVVRGIAQTSDGYLWIATLNGLARFDGVQFRVFNRSNTPGITGNRFSCIYQSPDGALWLVSENEGLTRYWHGTFKTFDINAIEGITGDKYGHIWVLSSGRIHEWHAASDRPASVPVPSPSLSYRAFRWGTDGFWALDNQQLRCFIRGGFTTYTLPVGVTRDAIWGVDIEPQGAVILEMLDGRQARLDPHERTGHFLSRSAAVSSAIAPQEDSWKVRVGRRLSRSIQFLSSGHSMEVSFSTTYHDREGNLWLGTEGDGLYELRRQSIQTLTKEQGLIERNVYPIFQDHSGAIWAGAWPSGLSRIDHGKITNYTTKDGLPNGLVTALWEDRGNNLWIGTRGGIAVRVGNKFRIPDELPILKRRAVQVIYQDRSGTLWFGTPEGLISFKDKRWDQLTVRNGLATNDVHTILQDTKGDLWVGGYGGLTRVHEGQFSRWTERDGLPSNTIRALFEDSHGVLWIGTYDGGLGRLKDGKFVSFTQSDGLFSDGVFQILEDPHGYLWLSCNRGIYRVSKQELNESTGPGRHAITSVSYGKDDGMLNAECNGGAWPAGITARNNRLWFPTQNGIAIVDLRAIRYNPLPPPVVIESVNADQQVLPYTPSVSIPAGRSNLEINYTAPSFINAKQIMFKYQLEGVDGDWVNAGTRRVAYYSYLPAGHYTFRVIAQNSDGVWNTKGQTLPVNVIAPLYRTRRFQATVMAMFGVAVAFFWRWRSSQLQKVNEAHELFSRELIASQEHERKRIAVELHDSLGQKLAVINNLALFFIRSENKEDIRPIANISHEASAAIEEARQIAYGLRPFHLENLGLTKALESLVRTVSRASSIEISSQLDKIDDVISEDLRINLYRIAQEALSNIMKHSGATSVFFSVQRTPSHVLLTIRDNGHGFSPENFMHHAHRGIGLAGMSERARLLDGDFQLRSAPGEGTIIVVKCGIRSDQGKENV